MTRQEFKRRGFRCIFRDGYVYLCPEVGPTRNLQRRPIADWEEPTATWENSTLTDDQAADFRATTDLCYCDQGVGLCDFCSHTRNPRLNPLDRKPQTC